MPEHSIAHFLKVSELYLKITEQKRSAENIDELAPLVFLNEDLSSGYRFQLAQSS